MKQIHELTWEEWKGLPLGKKYKYPKEIHNPQWTGYYVAMLAFHVRHGGTIKKRIWDALPEGYQKMLIREFEASVT